MFTHRKLLVRTICTTALCTLLMVGCSSSNDSASSEANDVSDISDGDNANSSVDGTEDDQSPVDNINNPIDESVNTPITDNVSESSDELSENTTAEFTRVTFDITVPVYVSNALQVRLTWGDKDINASWVADETWVIEDDFPANQTNSLLVMFNDDNGAIALGSFEAEFDTGMQATRSFSIAADQFNTARWDSDGDGFSNLDELISGTNPEALEAPAGVSATLELVPDKTVRIEWQPSPQTDFYRVFENPDGLSEFTQISDELDASTVRFDHAVPLHKRVNAEYRVEACNAVGCTDSTDPLEVGELDNGLALLQADFSEENDRFGSDLAISSDAQTLVVSALSEASAATGVNGDQSDNSLSGVAEGEFSVSGAGAAYVFVRVDGRWQQQAYLKASNTGQSDQFGWVVSISADGNTIAIGAHSERSSSVGIDGNQDDDSALRAGAVYVFSRNNGVWAQQAYVKASNTQAENLFGYAVSLSADGNTLAVGAIDEQSDSTEINGDQTQDPRNRFTGAVYVFSRQNSLWTQQAYLKTQSEDGADTCCFGGLGTAVSLSADGKTLAVGMRTRSERVIVFTETNGSWQQATTIVSPNRSTDGAFGTNLVLSEDGKTLAIAAQGESPRDEQGNILTNSQAERGVAYVFVLVDGRWQQQGYFFIDTNPVGRQFGRDIGLSGDGNTLAVRLSAGRMNVYTRTDGAWSATATLHDESPIPSLSISQPSFSGDGGTLATVGFNSSTDTRGVYLY